MTRTDLINNIAEKAEISKVEVEKALKAATDTIMKSVAVE